MENQGGDNGNAKASQDSCEEDLDVPDEFGKEMPIKFKVLCPGA